MASKRKCNHCKKFFDKESGINNGVSFFCCTEHAYASKSVSSLSKPKKPIKKKQGANAVLFSTKLKKRIKKRDGGCVFQCGQKSLQVHHIVYRSQLGWTDPLGITWTVKDLNHETNLVTLCQRHHDLVHSDKGLWQSLLKAYIFVYYFNGKKLNVNYIKKKVQKNDYGFFDWIGCWG